MKRVIGVRIWALGLMVVCASAWGRAAIQEEKYLLKDRAGVGDTVRSTSHFKFSFNLQTTVDGQEGPGGEFAYGHEHASTGTVLSVDPKGQATGKRLTFSRYRETEQEPGGSPKTKISTAEGKTVVLKRAGGRTTVTVLKGKVSAKDRAELAEGLDNEDVEFYPVHKVGLGEEWTVESAKLAKSFGTQGKATVHGRLIEKVQKMGRPCLRSEMSIEVAGRLKGQPIEVTLKLEGDVYYATDIKRTVLVSLEGPITIFGEMKEGGQAITFKGTGKAVGKLTDQWTRVNGKPVK